VKPPRPQKRPASDPWAADGEAGPSSVVQGRRNNRQRTVHAVSTVATEDRFGGVIAEPERARYPSEERDFEERELPATNTQLLTDVVYDIPVQIFAKAPNGPHGSWCSLSPMELSEVSFDVFCSMDQLKKALDSHTSFGSHPDKWDNAVANVFPTILESLDNKQNFSGLGARDRFVSLLTTLSPAEQAIAVKKTREYVNQRWVWLPAGKGRLWATGKAGVPKYAVREGPYEGGPWIVLNPRFARR
ncbi:hypothetical protein FRC10_007536, partial [Ceratobasidium sp. 414]